jgi:hypothetical protein
MKQILFLFSIMFILAFGISNKAQAGKIIEKDGAAHVVWTGGNTIICESAPSCCFSLNTETGSLTLYNMVINSDGDPEPGDGTLVGLYVEGSYSEGGSTIDVTDLVEQ